MSIEASQYLPAACLKGLISLWSLFACDGRTLPRPFHFKTGLNIKLTTAVVLIDYICSMRG